jgi:diacylglycerol O-acyltransferase
MSPPRADAALSHADAARLWMSSRHNPMVVTAVLPLDGPLDERDLRDLLRDRLLVHPRFCARIDLPRRPWNAPRWRADPALSLDRHVARVVLPAGSTEAALARAVSQLASAPLPLGHPPWRAFLIDGVGPGSVLVVRVHHAIADGAALLGVLFAVSDEGAGALPPPAAPAPAVARPLPSAAELIHGAAAFARLLLQRADVTGLVRGRPGPRKRVAWSSAVALEPVRRAAHAADAHINDLVLAALAGALRRAPLAPPSRALHALVPVALGHASGELGNQYASVFVALPVHVADRAERLRLVRDDARRARDGAGLPLGRALVDALGSFGGVVAARAGVELLSRRASAVASNVAGPPTALHVGGRVVTALRFAAPSPGAIPLSVSVASYAGELSFTVLADEHLGVAPDALAALLADELAALVAHPAPDGAPAP